MRKKIPNFTFEKFAFFVFLLALALVSAPQVLAQNIISDSGNILDIKASSTPTNSTFRFLPSTSANSFSLQGIANPANGESTVSIFEYLSSTSTFKMLDGVLDFNPTTNNIGIGISPTQKLHVAGNVRISGDIINDGNYGTGLVGLYSATRYQNVFAMGAAYRLAANGTAPGNMYGIAWTHSNIGGQSKAGLAHQALFMTNGVTQTAIGTGIWTLGGYTQTGTAVNTFSGNIGINTTVPQATLDVDGLIKMRSSNITTTSDVINKGYLDSALGGVFSSIDLAQYWKLSGSNLYPSSTAWNVGIGVVAPAEKLDVYGNIRMSNSGANQLQFTNANVKIYRNGNSMRIDSYDGWKFYDMQGSAERMRLTNLGNLGIGTTNPTFKLDVSGTGHFSDTLRVDNGLKYTGSNAIYFENIALKNNTTIPNGYIKLVTPIRTSHSQMFSIDITGYDYNVGKSIDFTISGYAYSGTDSVINLGFSNRSSFSRQVRVALEDRGDGYRVLVVTLGTSDGSGNCNDAWYFQKFGASVKLWGGPGTYTADQFTWVNGETSLATGYWQSSQLNNQVFDGQLGTITTFGNITSNSGVISMRGTGNNYFNGNVGIGTTLPNRRLDLGGGPTGRIYGIDTATSAVFTDSEVVPKKWIVDNFAPSVIVGSASLWATSSAGTYNVGLGNVGIGTTAPVKLLDIGSSVSTAAQYIRINSAAAYATGINFASAGTDKWWLYRPASSNDLRLYDGADRVTFQIGGNVGIGTIAPNQQLEITKNFRLPSTTGTTPYGVIYKDGNRFIHDFNYGLNGNGITTNGGNTFVGVNSGNLTMGSTAIASNQSSANTGVGYQALSANTTGYNNTAVGYRSLTSNTTGYYNTAVGYLSLTSNTTGYYNTANGYESLLSNTSGYSNTAYGHASLRSNSTGMENTAIGYNALYSNTLGFQNAAYGHASLQSNTSGYGNTGNGYQALYSNTTGNYNTANGMYSLAGNTTGSYNTALGFAAGNQNADYSGRTTGNNGLYLGRESRASANGTDNEIVIGYNAIGKGSNSATYGNTSMTKHIFEAGNVGIGSTSPVAKLVVSGGNLFISDATISSSTPHAAITKTYLDSALSALASTTSYWTYNDGHIYNNNSGNVGIGTGLNYPLAKLQINNEAAFNTLTPGPAAYYGLHFGGQTTADYATGITWNGGTSGTQAGLYVQGSGSYGTKMYFATTNSYATGAQTRMMIDQSGNVGIGTTAPGAYKLYVQGGLYANGNFVAGGDAYVAGGDIYDASGDLHVLGEDNLYLKMDYNNDDADIRNIIFAKNTGLATAPTVANELMRITEAGNVGIGISNPSYLLHVKGEASFGNSVVHEVSAPVVSTDAVNRNYVDSNFAPLSSSFWTPNPDNPNHIYNTNSGHVGIGVSAPAQKLDVLGSINASAGFKVNNTATSGHYLRGNGTNFVASGIQASDVPTLNQNTSGSAGTLTYEDRRTITPANLNKNLMKFGFTSYNNNNSSPYADFLHFRSYQDSSGGKDNLLVFNKAKLGMRLYQQDYGSVNPYVAYQDVVLAQNSPVSGYLTKYAGTGDTVNVTNSQIYDNGTSVGVGTTATGYKLNVAGSANFNNNQVHGISAPTVGTDAVNKNYVDTNFVASSSIPTISNAFVQGGNSFAGAATLGTNNNYALKFETNGTERMTILADGKVGIGSTNPLARLHISSNIDAPMILESNYMGNAGQLFFESTYGNLIIDALYKYDYQSLFSPGILSLNPSGGGVSFGGSVVVPNAVYNADSSRWLSFGPSGDSLKVAGNLNTTAGALNVSGTGNSWIMGKLGVGTTNPNSTAGMTIDTAATAPSILFRNAGVDKGMLTLKSGYGFGSNIFASGSGGGNIAIGSNILSTGSGSATSNIAIGSYSLYTSSGSYNIFVGPSAGRYGAGQYNIGLGSGAMTIDRGTGANAAAGSYNISIGNVYGGGTETNRLYIGSIKGGYIPLIYGEMGGSAAERFGLGIGTTTLGTTTAGIVALTVAGDMFATGAAYADGFYGPQAMGSDVRLKHNIETLSEDDYRKIFKLRPVSFTYNKDNRDDYGFIAQEVQKLYPETVTNGGDGNLYIYYNSLIAPTVAAVQAQEKKIAEQETLINILLDRVNKLENSAK